MKKLVCKIIITSITIFMISSSVKSQIVNRKEASIVAKNWIRLIIEKKGNWGGYSIAEIKEIQEFRRNADRFLGYFCLVKPSGFVVVSLNKALAPIKAYSETDDLIPKSEAGPIDLIKDRMEGILNEIEMSIGKIEAAKTEDVENLLDFSYRPAWKELEDDSRNFVELNYQQGEIMLSTHWNQNPPYNDQCPSMNCDNSNGRAIVGCTATAGSQLARYWSWPPYGEDGSPYTDPYDWPHMANQYIWDSSKKFWKDEDGNLLTQAHVDAVAELCHEIGEAVDMDYGCDASSAPICRWYETDMSDALEDHFRYNTGDCEDRDDYSATDWFNLLKAEFNKNRPVLYHVTNHSIVSDGWQEIGSTPTRQYHMNYGWGKGDNIWYTLDNIPLGDEDEEYVLLNIHPVQALGPFVTGVYTLESFPYRYFNEDVTGNNATFAAGQYLQILPGIKITCINGTIDYNASNSASTYLFLKGDLSKGIHIHNGAIKFYKNAGITFSKKY